MAAAGRSYRYEAVRISDLATLDSVIRDTTFEDCLLLGPAVLILENASVRDSSFVTDGGMERIYMEWTPKASPDTQWPIGCIPMTNCHFVRCEFRRITFAGPLVVKSELFGGTRPA